MPLETEDLLQKAVLWAASETAVDDDGNRKVSSTPIEINVRWLTKKDQTTNAKGIVIGTEGTVIVEQDIAIGSILWLGEIDDVATPPVNLFQTVSFDTTPDIRNFNTRRSVRVKRFGNTLPPTV
jgi:hypothetical protein